MGKIGKWKIVRRGTEQIHWVNYANSYNPTNIIVNHERDGSWAGTSVRNDSQFIHKSKNKKAMVDWAIRSMRLNPNG